MGITSLHVDCDTGPHVSSTPAQEPDCFLETDQERIEALAKGRHLFIMQSLQAILGEEAPPQGGAPCYWYLSCVLF